MKNPHCGNRKRTCCRKASNGHRIITKDLSEITYFLGMWITSVEDGTVWIPQFLYVWHILEQFRMSYSKTSVHLNRKQDCQNAGLRRAMSNLSTQSASDKWMVRCYSQTWYTSQHCTCCLTGRPRSPPNQTPSSKVSIVTNRIAQSTRGRSGLIWTIFCYDRYQWITATYTFAHQSYWWDEHAGRNHYRGGGA